MEITCEHCRAKLNIPNKKIPKDQRVKVNCPKCKKKIILHPRNAEHGDYGYREYSEDKDLDFFEESSKLTLVMAGNKEHGEKIRSAVESLGYRYITAESTRDAIGKMRFHHFDLIILADGFGGSDLKNSPVINHLNRLSMSIRRKIFLALISYDFKTMDDMMAFALSANVVINPKEMDRFAAILKKALTDNDRFYKVFLDTMAEVGKA